MIYQWVSVSSSGAVQKGSGQFATLVELRSHLQQRGLELIEARPDFIRSVLMPPRRAELKVQALIDFFSYMSSLMGMGMDMVKSVATVRETLEDPGAQKALLVVEEQIALGYSLSAAMTKVDVFPRMAIASIAAGEQASKLEQVFNDLAIHYRELALLKANAKKAAMYPLISLGVLMSIAFMILVLVVPQLEDIFPPNPPLPTKIMVALSSFIRNTWWSLPLVAVGLWVARRHVPAKVKTAIWRRVYVLPIIGRLTKQLALANLFMNLAMLTSGGVAIVEALASVSMSATSELLAEKLRICRDRVLLGSSLAEAFSDPFFPPIVISAVKQGETTGVLDKYFARLAQFLKERVNAQIAMLSTFIEPIIILIGGGIVLMLALAIFMPIYGQLGDIGKR